MTMVYEVFNTSSDKEFSSFLDKLSLTTNDLINVMDIAESQLLSLKEKQQQLLEYMSGTTYENYKLTLNQIKKGFKRTLKEDVSPVQPSLNLNQVLELNELVTLVASKLKAPNCMQGVFNIIKSKINGKAANAFLSMVQQADVNNSSLKFNTDLSIDGQNLAQAIYAIKNDIEVFVKNLQTPKKEEPKDEETVTEALINEAVSTVDQMIKSIEANIDSSNSLKDLEWIIKVIDNTIHTSDNTEQANVLASLKSKAQTKLNSINRVNPKVEECFATNVVSNACEENTFDSLVDNLKPTMISITVNKDNGEIEDCINDCGQSEQECNQALRQQIVDLIAQLCNAYQSTLTETCSAGATCAANVSGFAKPLGTKPKKRKKETEDVKLFKEAVKNNEYAGIMLENGKGTIDTIMYKVYEGKGYLYINNAIVGATTTESILEAFDDYYNGCMTTPVYEDFTHQELDLIMEDMLSQLNQPNDGDEKQMEKDLEQQFKTNPNLKLTVDDDKTPNQSMADQELVGIDDSDPENKQFVTKDPSTNKVKINKASQLHVQGNL